MGKKQEIEARESTGFTRRSFLGGASAGLAGIALSPRAAGQQATEKSITAKHNEVLVHLAVNGEQQALLVEPRMSLLFVLRERLGLTGTKIGCERGECGACTVIIDGKAQYACLTLAVEAEHKKITTIEGLAKDGVLSPIQQAFIDQDAYQCGYCTSGQIMAAEAFLQKNLSPSVEDIREAMSGNLCRCGAYRHIVQAVAQASRS